MSLSRAQKTENAMNYIASLGPDRFDFIKDMLVSYLRIAELQTQNYERLSQQLCLARHELEISKNREQVVRDIARLPGGRRD